MHRPHRVAVNSEPINFKEVKIILKEFKSKKSMKYNIQQK